MKKAVIRIDPLEEDLYLYIGEDKDYLLEIHEDFADIGEVNESWNAFHAVQMLKSGKLAHLMYIELEDYGLIVHELIHCVKTLMDSSGIDNEEFMAYMCQHLFYEIKKVMTGDS